MMRKISTKFVASILMILILASGIVLGATNQTNTAGKNATNSTGANITAKNTTNNITLNTAGKNVTNSTRATNQTNVTAKSTTNSTGANITAKNTTNNASRVNVTFVEKTAKETVSEIPKEAKTPASKPTPGFGIVLAILVFVVYVGMRKKR